MNTAALIISSLFVLGGSTLTVLASLALIMGVVPVGDAAAWTLIISGAVCTWAAARCVDRIAADM